MKASSAQLALLIAFAVFVGDFAFRTWQGPIVSEFRIEEVVEPMTAAVDSHENKHLYLRRSWTFTDSPDYAWIRVMGHDIIQVFVNGRQVGRTQRLRDGRIGATVVDITSYLRAGENLIAIHAQQMMHHRVPQVAIEGECLFATQDSISLSGAEGWLATDTYDRRGHFWYEVDYPDEHWEAPRVGEPVAWKSQVAIPPGAVTTPRSSQWMTPTKVENQSATFATQFDLSQQPHEAWMRVAATGPYRVSVNGWMVTDDRLQIATDSAQRPFEQTLDLTPLLKPGNNTVSIAISNAGGAPRTRADLQAIGETDNIYIASDANWKSTAGIPSDWLEPDTDSDGWQATTAIVGYGGVMPRAIMRTMPTDRLPALFNLSRILQLLGCIALAGLFAKTGGTLVGSAITRLDRPNQNPISPTLAYWALLPSTTLAAAGGMMTWDVAWTSREIYQPVFLLGLGLLVLVMWLLLYGIAAWRPSPSAQASSVQRTPLAERGWGFACAWIVLFVLAAWLRFSTISDEPMHHDEVSAYTFTMSIFEHGFPTFRAHEDMPMSRCSTSELTYYFTAACALFTDDPKLILRVPAVLWSLATLLLIGYVGSKWFNRYVGFLAGVIFAIAPHMIAMAVFGRYLSQVQFFVLLTTYFAYEAIRGTGKLRTGYLWASAFSVIAMYLSWEGSGLYGVGMAAAALLHRRRHLSGLFTTAAVYPAVLMVILVVIGQNAHRTLQQTQRLWLGTGISSLELEPMWRFPVFDGDYYLLNASWSKDALIPMAAVAGAFLLSFKHRWRLPIRFLLICLISNAGLMSALLPLHTNRYSYHLIELVILLAAVVAGVVCEALFSLVRDSRYTALRLYASTITAVWLGLALWLGSGWSVHSSELKSFVVPAQDVTELRSPDWEGPSRFLYAEYQPGDVLISILPHAQDYQFAMMNPESGEPISVDYWLETQLVLQAAISDSSEVARDRRSGALMIYDIEQLFQIFAEHDRVWLCTSRAGHTQINEDAVSKYLREHMDVVYEDLGTSILLRDRNHRTAELRQEEEKAGTIAKDFYLY